MCTYVCVQFYVCIESICMSVFVHVRIIICFLLIVADSVCHVWFVGGGERREQFSLFENHH